MAKVTITIEDMPNNKVKIEVNPSMEHFFRKIHSGNIDETTSAEGYAIQAINEIRSASKNKGTQKLFIPRTRGL